jgi:Tfp pilus assembly protein PilZ
MKLPLYLRLLSRPNPQERVVESSNISTHGVCFISDDDLMVGEPVQITLSMPAEITGDPEEMLCFSGRVVHTSPVGNRQRAIGVQFVYSERV